MEFDIIQMISTVGFPIVAFLLIYWQSNTTINKNTCAIQEMILYLRGGRK
jgi:hypothetical protein